MLLSRLLRRQHQQQQYVNDFSLELQLQRNAQPALGVGEGETNGRKCCHLYAKNHGVIFQAASPTQLPVMSYNSRDTDTASGRQSSRLRSHIRIMHSKLNA